MTATNEPEFTVSELSTAIKRTMEESFERVRVRAEISGYRGPHSSGHCYFALKDQNAKLDAIIWKGVFGRLKFRPEEGMEVIATGKITTFPGKSSYQIVIDQLEPAGIGALLAQLEERKKRLAAEGLFAQERKQLIPYIPEIIGVITSPTGAVIRDIIHRIADRFPRYILIWPVRVQGETCASEVAAAIEGFNSIEPNGDIPRPDVLIVARGGGSLEDLWGFNDELVARAASLSEIPLISAVGHETDTTLIDFVSDLRAPTPTGAAEFVVPVRLDLMHTVHNLESRLHSGSQRLHQRRILDLRSVSRAMPSLESLLNIPRQRLDLCAVKLPNALRAGLDQKRNLLNRQVKRLDNNSPLTQLVRYRERLNGFNLRLGAGFKSQILRHGQSVKNNHDRLKSLHPRLKPAFSMMVERKTMQLTGLWKLLNTLGHKQVLSRGYAIIKSESGAPLRSAKAVSMGMNIQISFEDGDANATIAGRPSRNSPKATPLQSSLF